MAVCPACDKRLKKSELTPLMWYHLVVTYGAFESRLGSEHFYSNGRSTNRNISEHLYQAEPMPRFDGLKNNLSELIEYSFFPYPNVAREEIFLQIGTFTQDEILAEVERLSQSWPTVHVINGCCELGSNFLKERSLPSFSSLSLRSSFCATVIVNEISLRVGP